MLQQNKGKHSKNKEQDERNQNNLRRKELHRRKRRKHERPARIRNAAGRRQSVARQSIHRRSAESRPVHHPQCAIAGASLARELRGGGVHHAAQKAAVLCPLEGVYLRLGKLAEAGDVKGHQRDLKAGAHHDVRRLRVA